MTKIRLLVTCVRGSTVPALLGCLHKSSIFSYYLVGVDSSSWGNLRELLDNYYQVPNGSDNRNIEKILDIVKNEKIEFILPGADEEAICISNSPEQVDSLLSNFDFDLIQVPFNVFDARLTRDGQLSTLKNKNVEIHTRSAFLQGMLLNFDNLPKHFKTWEKQFNEYQAMVKESGMSWLEYALNFALNIWETDKFLVGVNSERQLKEIVQAVKGTSSIGAYPIDDINLLNPSLGKTWY